MVLHVSAKKLIEYLSEQRTKPHDYEDYIKQCKELSYNLQDSMYMFPHNFHKMHQRCSELINVLRREQEEKKRSEESKLITQRVSELEPLKFEHNGLMVVIPESTMDVLNEGKALNHCVGSYAGRHARGQLNILFIRTADKPDVPFYTMELSKTGDVVQVRGYRNSNPTDEVKMFIQEYKAYISKLFEKKVGKSA